MGRIADGTASLLFSCAICLCVKRGLLSIATQELLLALQPSPLALSTASRPGIPAAAELTRGPGPQDVQRLHLTISQEHTAVKDPRPGATRLKVGPRESRAGSRVPRYTSQPCRASHVSGRGCTRPGGSSRRGPPPTHKWKHHAPRWPSTLPRSGYAHAQAEALCSALVINN